RSAESFDDCFNRVKEPFNDVLSVSDAMGWYGLGAAGVAVGGEVVTRVVQNVANDAEWAAKLAGTNPQTGPLKWLKAQSAARKGAEKAARLQLLQSGLGVTAKVTGAIGLGATAISVITRASVGAYC